MKLKDLVPLKESTPVNQRTKEYIEGWSVAALQDRLEQVYMDMEQEAEPEGGPIADEYADEITALEDAITIKKRGGVSMTSDYISKDAEGFGDTNNLTYGQAIGQEPLPDGSYLDKHGKKYFKTGGVAKDKDTFTKSSKFDRLKEQEERTLLDKAVEQILNMISGRLATWQLKEIIKNSHDMMALLKRDKEKFYQMTYNILRDDYKMIKTYLK